MGLDKKDIWASGWIKWYILNKLFLKLRVWDFIASKRCDITLANSSNTKKRISKYYRKDSEVLYPPVETERFEKPLPNPPLQGEGNYYIIISALTEFKKIEVAIEWFNKMSDKNLIIIWSWDYKNKLVQLVQDEKNIQFVWPKYSDELVQLVQNSKWLIFPGEEDFWIVPIEVMAAWKPVFAYRWWWLLETVVEWITWEFFYEKDWGDFVEKFKIFDENNMKNKYKSNSCKKQSEKFSETKFEKRIKELGLFFS